jgi:hypothetical protein
MNQSQWMGEPLVDWPLNGRAALQAGQSGNRDGGCRRTGRCKFRALHSAFRWKKEAAAMLRTVGLR